MNEVTLIFPHQLFEDKPAIQANRTAYLIEESLFFNQYPFHKQKICFHRASMKFYQHWLNKQKFHVKYIEANSQLSDVRNLIESLHKSDIQRIHFTEPVDDWLEKRIKKSSQHFGIEFKEYSSPLFINSKNEINNYFNSNKNLLQTKFYIEQRIKRNILLEKKGLKPFAGKWTFDIENRKKYPKDKNPPKVEFPQLNSYYKEAIEYTEKYFKNNPGQCNLSFRYPVTFDESKKWLQQFFSNRFQEFGPYEDAMVSDQSILHHSLLSPLLNSGLLSPQYVITETLAFHKKHTIPINSVEGFIRQILGWREFIRGVYQFKGVEQRTKNFWKFSNNIPASFYQGTTGITPVDLVIKRVLETGYCHHIERLMVMGNFMLLCEFNPNEVYKWFMELFIDAYDWVMVPNVYGMSQFADGGLMATKPYISGSNYILKMSNFKKGDWQKTWDALFWRFMHVHREFFLQNPRLGLLIKTFDKMPKEKKKNNLIVAKTYLENFN
jgi:deoxyribodipyrimidine photolyase-related protein